MMKDRAQQFWSDYRDDAVLALGVALVAFTAFGFGRATAPRPPKTSLTVEELPLAATISDTVDVEKTTATQTVGKYVASKNGTRYYLPTCSGANRIKEENKIWFTSIEEAQSEGYEPAVNCPGLTAQ